MSRIGKLPIIIPPKVEANFNAPIFSVKGPHGELSRKISDPIFVEIKNNMISVKPKDMTRSSKALYGLSRTLINNMVIGVSEKFERRLTIFGVGYRAQMKGKELVLNLGYSHPITITPPSGIELKVEVNTTVIVSGIDKEVVGQISALIRSKRLPEPYKGKGVLYQGEIVKRKAGKSGK